MIYDLVPVEIVPRSSDNVNRINGSVIGNNGYDLPFLPPLPIQRTGIRTHSGQHGYKIDACSWFPSYYARGENSLSGTRAVYSRFIFECSRGSKWRGVIYFACSPLAVNPSRFDHPRVSLGNRNYFVILFFSIRRLLLLLSKFTTI